MDARHKQLDQSIERQVARMKKAEAERDSLLAQSVFLGTMAGLFIIPVIGGAYLGHWLDGKLAGYSVRWTVSLILSGVGIGGFNVWWYWKRNS